MNDMDSTTAELIELAKKHLWIHSGYPWESVQASDGLRIMESGDGAVLKDSLGREVIDLGAGLWLANTGYGRREIAEAMMQQASQLQYTRSDWPTAATVRLAARIAELTPGDLDAVFLVSGGGEANEAALKMALQYHRLRGELGRTKFIGRNLSYHGASFATMSVGGAKLLNRALFESGFIPDVTLMTPPEKRSRGVDLVDEFEKIIVNAGPETIAAFIGEPISNSGGIFVPDADYWPGIREVCNRHGVLMITDEVVTGFGRTGKMFGIEHWDVVPDIMTMAKGLSSGYAPVGAAVARQSIFETFRPGKAEAFQHVITFGGQAVACAGALANLKVLEDENLVDKSCELGEYLHGELEGLKERHPSVADVRGLGLMRALQMSRSTDRSIPFTPKDRSLLTSELVGYCLQHGVNFQGHVERLVFMPPLVITRAQLDQAVSVLDKGLTFVEEKYGWWG